MKKTICMLLVLFILVITAIASAENDKINFVLGLELGMSANEAVLKTGFVYETISDSAQKENRDKGIYGSHYLYGNATIAGYDVFVTCYTDEKDNICQISYSFEDDSYAQYETLESTLAKYGTEPYQGGKPITHGIKTQTISSPYMTIKYKVLDSFDRIIPYNNGTVLIEHCYYTSNMSSSIVSSSSECHMLCYSYIDANLDTTMSTQADF